VAQQYVNRTNRALGFARIQLRALEEAQTRQGWSQEMQIGALEAAVCFHLSVAMHAYRREIAERYTLPTESIHSLEDLLEIQQLQGQATGEATEFSVLHEQQDSWLNQLDQRYQACWNSDSSPAKGSETSSSEISLVQIEPGKAKPTELSLEMLYSELYALINRQRSAMQEW